MVNNEKKTSDTEVAAVIGGEMTSSTPADGDNDDEEVVNLIDDENRDKLVFDLVCDVAATLLGWTSEGRTGLQNAIRCVGDALWNARQLR
jgi:hypothetical protein